MFSAVENPYLVPFDGSFRRTSAHELPPRGAHDDKVSKKRLEDLVQELDVLQRELFVHDRYAVLLVFQAMDAAGKDGTIRSILSGINPAGCQVFSFRQPSSEELDHDFLWRSTARLPERGRVGVFNRSYYESVLIERVHPEVLAEERLPGSSDRNIWKGRFESIRDHEKHLARNGTIILKFWLNVSKEEQRKRLLERIKTPEKNWKVNADDVHERKFWDAYMDAYEEALNQTSRSWAPWYAIPADNKHYMRSCVAEIVVSTLKNLDLKSARPDAKDHEKLAALTKLLEADS